MIDFTKSRVTDIFRLAVESLRISFGSTPIVTGGFSKHAFIHFLNNGLEMGNGIRVVFLKIVKVPQGLNRPMLDLLCYSISIAMDNR